MAANITTTWLRGAWPGKDLWKSDGAARGNGQLVARRRRDGVLLYFRHVPRPGDRHESAVPLGPYDEKGVTGLTLTQARERAAALAALYRDGVTDLKAHQARELAATEAARQAQEAAARAEAESAQRATLEQLLTAYVAHLRRAGKVSARDVEGIFANHVLEAAPELAARKAAELTSDDFVELIGRLVEANKGRTAAKLRSGLRAAYALAVRSRTDPSAPAALRAFGIRSNPISDISALARFNRARNRHLSAGELGAFLRRVEGMPAGAQQDALRLTLFLGGQRPTQLLRLKPTEVDLAAGTLTLFDGKGARQQPRVHVLPLVKEASAILERRLKGLAVSEPVFSTDAENCMRPETISYEVGEIVKKMLAEDPPEAREAFQMRDLRRTCETMMASLKISSDIRAQLQSHGLGGIQQRHYDRHDYMLEKRQSLQKWARHLETLKAAKATDSNVVPIGTRRRSQ